MYNLLILSLSSAQLLKCWAFSRKAADIIFKVFGMTQLRIKPSLPWISWKCIVGLPEVIAISNLWRKYRYVYCYLRLDFCNVCCFLIKFFGFCNTVNLIFSISVVNILLCWYCHAWPNTRSLKHEKYTFFGSTTLDRKHVWSKTYLR